MPVAHAVTYRPIYAIERRGRPCSARRGPCPSYSKPGLRPTFIVDDWHYHCGHPHRL